MFSGFKYFPPRCAAISGLLPSLITKGLWSTTFFGGIILQTKKIDKYTSERLTLAAEYYAKHHKLLSKYYNGEVLEESKRTSRH